MLGLPNSSLSCLVRTSWRLLAAQHTDHGAGESAVGKVIISFQAASSIQKADPRPLEFSCPEICQGQSSIGWFDRNWNSEWLLIIVKDQFDDYRESTIGAAFLTQTISLDDATTVKFEIWDTAGQERYKSLAPMYYRNANCAVVVYDITQAVCHSRKPRHSAANELLVFPG